MIGFEEFYLDNGLRVVVHEDHNFPSAVVNIMYDVGSRDEEETRTGFAHLFEHLMFGGSKNIPSYDEPLQKVGGTNNAFTSPDITNYYVSLPSVNIETAFWLESDRMLSLSFDPNVLEVQRKVVIEEFKQRYLNQPYGDTWHKIREMAYEKHPYRWPTIGKEISHVEQAVMEEVKAFFFKYYCPANAVLVVAGNVTLEQVKRLSEKWFGSIPSGVANNRSLPQEPKQKEAKILSVEADVPLDALYKVWHMDARLGRDYYPTDLLSDILGRGKSSLLYKKLVKEEKVFSALSAYITGSFDPGLLCIGGRVQHGVEAEEANTRLEELLNEINDATFTDMQMEKVKNQVTFGLNAGKSELLPRALGLAYGAVLGNTNLVNEEEGLIKRIEKEDIARVFRDVVNKENSSTLIYKAKN
ncbi:pitrilysin family protein [Algivirga pacifica]|uniref:Pitrilysin family protein n=1 Tax=Algivirga pacifica TaxID=1162670 RepID=A0ABP9DIZ5_9BACT